MPVVDIERILSVSSEDHAYPAINLLKSDNGKKWRCKAGEKQASIILQLKQDTVLEGIDIGNENSAFVEVLVGKSSSPNSDFKILLVTSSLMTLNEAKGGTNRNGVRFFKRPDLTKLTADEKWDRVKIVCTQPFNKFVQYGLSFVVLHSANEKNMDDETRPTLGRFMLKQEEKDQPVTVGSWFAKRKDAPSTVPLGAAAAIRDASLSLGIAQGKIKKAASHRPKITTPKNDDEDSPADDTDADSTYSPDKDSISPLSNDDIVPVESDERETGRREKKLKRNKKVTTTKNGQTPKRKNSDSLNSKTKFPKVTRVTKPFERLLEGVTIVISGYQNPLRGTLRSKAFNMGAKYKADWDNTCTHLICAFVNTPKFNQVCGRGKIVKKEWIEECYNCRKRLPWRRFSLDKNDIGTSSEDEIWEEESIPTTSDTRITKVDKNRHSTSSGSDTEEEIERVRVRQAENKPIKERTKIQKVDKQNKLMSKETPDVSSSFADDTDVDSDSESLATDLPLPPLPDFFNNIVFHISGDIDDNDRRKLRRYITAYKGCIEDEINGCVEYIITKLPDIAAKLTEEFATSAVSPEWVWECSDAGKLIPVNDFLL